MLVLALISLLVFVSYSFLPVVQFSIFNRESNSEHRRTLRRRQEVTQYAIAGFSWGGRVEGWVRGSKHAGLTLAMTPNPSNDPTFGSAPPQFPNKLLTEMCNRELLSKRKSVF